MTQSNLKTTSSKHTGAARSRGPVPNRGWLRLSDLHLPLRKVGLTVLSTGCTYRVSPRQLTNMYAHARAKHTHELLTCAECSWSTTTELKLFAPLQGSPSWHPNSPLPSSYDARVLAYREWIGVDEWKREERCGELFASIIHRNHPVTAGEPYPALDFSTLTTLPWTPSPSPPFYIGDFFQIPPGFQSMPSPTSSSSSLDPLQDPIFSFVPPANLPPFDFNSFFIPSAWSPLQDPNWPFRFAGSERSMLFQAPDSSDITFLTYNPGQETTNYSPFGCGVPNGSGWMGPFQ
ncbi:hypothetical protein DL96DRAFT_1675006 [Flagelloscypha sp. PMI_526]|nr:hypothetical protein DL96DRAFT_1675006 [Flagelloscypha sp. PMI_526]